jgi:hypothetical protein
MMEDVRLYQRALSAEEIAALADSGPVHRLEMKQ